MSARQPHRCKLKFTDWLKDVNTEKLTLGEAIDKWLKFLGWHYG